MSAVVQELYPGLSVALSTERAALSDPAVVLDAEPEASAFVLPPCSNGLPAEHQRTYGLNVCSDEKLDCTSEASRPRLMALLSRESAGAGGLPEEEKALSRTLEEGSLGEHLREGAAGEADGRRSVAEEGLGLFSLASKEDSWSKEEPWLIQAGSEFLSRPSCAEIAGSLDSLEENQANVQVATESLPSPTEEAQGMKADWTRLFSKAGESSSQGSAGDLPESSECSAAEVSETGPLVSLEPVSVTDNALVEAPLPEEEEKDHQALTANATFSAPAGILSSPEAGRENFVSPDADVKAILASCLPSQQSQTNLPSHLQPVSVLDSKGTLAVLPSDASLDALDSLFKGCFECGNALGEEATENVEAVCETEGEERSSRSPAGGEEIELLEEWACPPKVEAVLSPPWSSEELPSDSEEEQQAGDCLDHSYSCVCGRTAEVEEEEEEGAVQRCRKETQECPPAEMVKPELQNGQFAKERRTPLANGTPFRLGVARPSPEEHSKDGLRLGTDNAQKDEPQQHVLPSAGSLAPAAEDRKSPLGEANCLGCFWNTCTTDPLATSHSCDAQLCGGPLLHMDSNSKQGTEIGTSAAHLHVASSSRAEEMSQTVHPSDVRSFSQQLDAIVSSCRCFDTLPKEEVPGTRAQLLRNREEASSVAQDRGRCTKSSEEAWSSTARLLGGAEERTADTEAGECKACGHTDRCVSSLCAAGKTCGTTLRSVSLDGDILQVRTKTDGLETCHASVSARTVGSLQECGDKEALDCPANENCLESLSGMESTLSSICFVDVPDTGPMKADVLEPREAIESQKSDGDCCRNAGEMLDADLTHICPPGTDPEEKLTKASLVTGPDDVESCENSQSSEAKLRGDTDLEKTVPPLELGEFLKGQGKEELPRPQARSSSPLASEMSSTKMDLNSDPLGLAQQQGWPLHVEDRWTKDQGQLQGATCRNYCNRLASFNQKSESLETEGLECQQCLLIISCKQNKDCTGQAETHPAEKAQSPVSCHPSERLCPKGDRGTAPPAPGLSTENEAIKIGLQDALGSCSSSEMASESLRDLPNGACVEPGNGQPPSERLEPPPKRLRVKGLVQEQAGAAQMREFSSASQATSRNPSDALDESHFLPLNCESASPPTQTCFHPDSVTLATADGQTRTEGALSERGQHRGMDSSVLWSAQDPAACLSERGEPLASPALDALCSHPAKDRSSATGLLETEGDDQTNQFPSESEKARCPFKEDASVGSSPPSQVKPSCVGDRKAEVTGATASSSSYSVDPTEMSLCDCQKEGVQAARRLKLAVQVLSSSRDSSGPFLQDLKLHVGKQETAVSLKAGTQARFPFVHPSEVFSGLCLSKDHPCVKDPSKPAVVRGHAEDTGRALPSEDLLSLRSPGTLCRAAPCASQGGQMSEAAPRGRNWQSAEGNQELAGGRQVSGGHLVNRVMKVPAKNIGKASAGGRCPALVQTPTDEAAQECPGHPVAVCSGVAGREKGKAGSLLKQRVLRTGQPLESSLHGRALNPKMPPPQASAVRCVVEGSKTETSLRGLNRPKSCQDLAGLKYTGANIPSRSFRSCSRPGAGSNIPAVPASFTLLHNVAFGCSGIRGASGSKVRRPLPFQGRPGKACRKVPGPGGGSKAARKSVPAGHSTFLKNPMETVPTHKYAPPDSLPFAVQAGAVEKKRAVIWDHMPKPRASQSSLWDPFRLSARTKDQAVLRRLSALAHRLLPPARNQQRLKPPLPPCSAEHLRLSEMRSWLRSQKLLQVFSCINVKSSSRWMNGSRPCPKISGSPPLALYPVESVSVCFLELSDKTPVSPRAPLFPVSFHMKMSAVPPRGLLGAASPQGVPNRVALGGAHGALLPSEWIFSFLLPQSCLGTASVQGGAWMPAESSLAPASLSAAMDDGERDAFAQSSTGWPGLGLQTVLALSSPGCYRVWTKKRHLASRIPAIQKLAVLQFTRGLKGLTCSASDLFSSLPYSLGRGLSIWSQQGPSTCSSEFTPLHSNHCKWQPLATASTSLGLRNSSATLPHVPGQAIEAPRVVNDETRLGPSLSALLPTSCTILEPALSPLGFLAPEYQAHEYLDELDVSVPVLPKTRARLDKAESEKRPKKVSQIRIRKTIPKPDPNLTPMGLPRPKRLKKTEFSLEEIYTNKNYKSPPATRCLETIFEEPRERNGSLISVSQQKRKRILEFQDFTIPRKRKARARVKVMGGSTRAQKAALEGRELDVLLIQKLTDLEAFFAEEEQEQTSGS